LLAIKKGYNPVSLGLCLQAYSYLMTARPEGKHQYLPEINHCLEELIRLRSQGYSGACWGYDFDWEARHARIPSFTPTIVATGIITNALFEYYALSGDARAVDLCQSAVVFVQRDLHKTYAGKQFCYSYSPHDRQTVLNATMKGARLLAQVYSATGERALLEEARRTVQYVVDHQHPDGSWPYAAGDGRTWIDNFHTGYILDCLHEYLRLSSDRSAGPAFEKGKQFYIDKLFSSTGLPKYYHTSLCPIDSTAAAQSILTLNRIGSADKAAAIALWMIRNMQHHEGFFYYRRHRLLTNKISYMRWSNAWMFMALAYTVMKQNVLV
jgi:hypothetical protein